LIRGTSSPLILAFFLAVPSSSSKMSGPVPTGCTGTFTFWWLSPPRIKSGSQ
jgi:hypothetical protein